MRPKRKILLVDVNFERRSVMRFALRIWGYRVAATSTLEGVDRITQKSRIDLAIFSTSIPEKWTAEAARLTALRQSEAQTLFVSDRMREAPLDVPFTTALLRSCTVEQLRDCVWMMTQRKRGPKKGWKVQDAAAPPKFGPARVGLAEVLSIRRIA